MSRSPEGATPSLTLGEIEELERKFSRVILWAQMMLEQARWDRAKAGHHDIAFTKEDGSKHGGLWQDEWDDFVAIRDGIPALLSMARAALEKKDG